MKNGFFTYKLKKTSKKKTFGDFVKSPKFLIILGVIITLFIAFIIVGNALGRVAERSKEDNQYTSSVIKPSDEIEKDEMKSE